MLINSMKFIKGKMNICMYLWLTTQVNKVESLSDSFRMNQLHKPYKQNKRIKLISVISFVTLVVYDIVVRLNLFIITRK